MPNYTPNTPKTIPSIRAELERISNSLEDKLDRRPDEGQENSMEVSLDMSDNSVFNLKDAELDHEAVNLRTLRAELGGVNGGAIPAYLTETRTLSNGQLVVNFTRQVSQTVFFVNGEGVDRGRLERGVDFTQTGDNQITLTESYPAGSVIIASFVETDLGNLNGYVQTFDTVADMKSAPLEEGQLVRTKGYYVPGDGGDALYNIVPAGQGADDGGSYIDVMGAQARLVFDGVANVRQWGAKGDGVEGGDLTPVTNAALFSKVLYFPAGAYNITGGQVEYDTLNDIRVFGDGFGSKIVRSGDVGNVISISNSNRISVTDLYVQGRKEFLSGAGGINLTNCTRFTISRNFVTESSRQGIKTENCQNGTISDNLVTGNYQDGIMVRTGSQHVTVTGNVCWNNGDPLFDPPIGEGIHLFSATHCTVSGNVSFSNNDHGIAVEGGDYSTISGNVSRSNVVAGLSLNLEGSSLNQGLQVTGNVFDDNGSDGVVAGNSTGVGVKDNTMSNNGGYGVKFDAGSGGEHQRMVLKDNYILDNALGGVIADWNFRNGVISENFLRGSAGRGILINRAVAEDNKVVGNTIQQFPVAALTDNGTRTRIKENIGYVTENSGTATFSATSTAEFVNHGLDYTPNVSDISVVVSSASTANPIGNLRVYNPNSSQFTIGFDNAAGTGGVDIAWAVRKTFD